MAEYTKPLIGITPNYEKIEEFHNENCYISRTQYPSSLSKFSAIPLIITHDYNAIDFFVEKLDGILFTGGNYDINPIHYGETIKSDNVVLNENRSSFEMTLFKKFFDSGKPILGICAGHQLINVMLGGSLIQDIKSEYPESLDHARSDDRRKLCHQVKIQKNSLLHKIIQEDEIYVNTSHRQAVKDPGKNITISGISPVDNIVEAIEVNNHKFCVGIEWHPEYLLTPADKKIFQAFVKACTKNHLG